MAGINVILNRPVWESAYAKCGRICSPVRAGFSLLYRFSYKFQIVQTFE
jgi:hypothetical protein